MKLLKKPAGATEKQIQSTPPKLWVIYPKSLYDLPYISYYPLISILITESSGKKQIHPNSQRNNPNQNSKHSKPFWLPALGLRKFKNHKQPKKYQQNSNNLINNKLNHNKILF